VDPFASGITNLTVDTRCVMADAAVEETCHTLKRLNLLKNLAVEIDVQHFGGNHESTNLLVRALPDLQVQRLKLCVHDYSNQQYNVRQVLEDLDDLSDAAVRSNWVERLGVKIIVEGENAHRLPIPGYDGCSLLERWFCSESLEYLTLDKVLLTDTNDVLQRRQVGGGVANNCCVKRIYLIDTHVGPEGLRMFSRFKGVSSIEFRRSEIHGADTMAPCLFDSLGNLSSFSWSGMERNEDLAWIASNLRGALPPRNYEK
jgi:hypothetical protein